MPALHLALLGSYQVDLAGNRIAQFPTAKVQALLAYLAVEAQSVQGRDTLIGLFWPNYTLESARQNLRQTLFRLRQLIPPAFLLVTNQNVQFDLASDYRLDVTTFTDLITACRRHAHPDLTTCAECSERLEQAVALYRGDFLAGFFLDDSPAFEEWLLLKREWLRREALQALSALSVYHERTGAYAQAQVYAWRQLELDAASETAHRQLMRILARSGRRSEALAQYLACCRLLASELNVEPAPETTALYEQIRAGLFSEPTDQGQDDRSAMTPPLILSLSKPHAAHSPPHNLPHQVTSFIGRVRELEEVKLLLSSQALGVEGEGIRLLTLTGAGGSGKTRLALQTAAHLLKHYQDGVWFVDLAPLAEPNFVPQAVSAALGVREQPGQPILATLASFLHPKHLLLVLDNCEHLIDACARLVTALLAAAPHVQILATSREVLAIAGERVWPVPGLARPQWQPLPPIAQLSQADAIRLFVARATSVTPTFRLTEQNAAAVVQICGRLEGLPLAIELAAVRVKVLGVPQLAERLNQHLALLTGGQRSAPRRHQTLRATLDWSYQLLSEPEQALLRRLAVFAGGFDLEAVKAIAQDECLRSLDTPAAPFEVLDLLTRLVDKSLLQVEWQPDGAVRYRLLEMIRQYAQEQLASLGEETAVGKYHAHYYLALAEMGELALYGAQQVEWSVRLELEYDNLRAALAWSQADPARSELELRLAGALSSFWRWHSHLREGREWLETALTRNPALTRTPAHAKALCWAGMLAINLGDAQVGMHRMEESVACWREVGDRQGLAHALIRLANEVVDSGDAVRTRSLVAESLTLCQQLGDRWGIAWSRLIGANVAVHQGEYADAQGQYGQALTLFREVGDSQGIGLALHGLGCVARNQGEYETGRLLFEQALTLFRILGDRLLTAMQLDFLATVVQKQGDHRQAAALYADSIALACEIDFQSILPLCLGGLAEIMGLSGQAIRAAHLFGAAARLAEELDLPLPYHLGPDFTANLAAVRATLGAETFAAAWQTGQTMTRQEAIAYALAAIEGTSLQTVSHPSADG